LSDGDAFSGEVERLAVGLFLSVAAPALVKEAAELLRAHDIAVMPLKGVLLQKLVYRDRSFRRISDVDLLVPTDRFGDAYAALKAAGFSETHWESGGWEVSMRRPGPPSLSIDLHRLLSGTTRSNLTAEGLFARGAPDQTLFGAPVVLPRADDLFAHLLLHASLHWINKGDLHHPEDFQALADASSLDASRCAAHLRQQGLVTHALVLAALLRARGDGGFLQELTPHLRASTRARVAARAIRAICARFAAGHPLRRLAGLAVAPSLATALVSAIGARLRTRRRPDGA
jgi:hypothetical protein